MSIEFSPPVIAYVGSSLPSLSETFVYKELFAVREAGITVLACSVFVPNRFSNAQGFDTLACETTVVYSFSGWIRSIRELTIHPLQSISTITTAIQDSLKSKNISLGQRLKFPMQAVASLGLARQLRSLGVGHIHAHMANTPTTIAMYAAKQLGIGFSFTGHANDLFVHRSLLKEKLQRACFIACISEWHRRLYQTVTALENEKLPIIRCGVEIPPLVPEIQQTGMAKGTPSAPFQILSVGRLVDKKGMDTLIRAIAKIDTEQDIRCDIIGDGPLKEDLISLVSKLGLHDQIRLRGACPNSEVLESVRNCDLFVLACQRDAITGDQDGIPVSLMEAMAQGKCVVTTDLDPITELVIHERTGLCVPERDPEKLAAALVDLMNDAALRVRLARRGREHVEREFSQSGNIERLIACFNRCLASRFSKRVDKIDFNSKT